MHIKRIMRCTAGLLALLVLMPFSVFAAERANDDVIKVGYLPNYATINNLESLNMKGYGYEFFEEISKYTGRQYEFVPCTMENGLEMLQTGELDLLGPLEKPEIESTDLVFPTNDFGSETILLCAPKEAEICYDDFPAIDGTRIGTIDQNYFTYLDSYLQGGSVEYTRVDCISLALSEHLADDHFDLVLTSSMYALPDTKIVGALGTYPIFYAAGRDNAYLVEELDDALTEIYRKDMLFAFKLYEKYFMGSNYPAPTLSKRQVELLRQHGTFTVEISSQTAPLQYRNKDGQPAGVCVDIMDQIAEILGIEVEYVFFDPDNSQSPAADISLCYLQRQVEKENYIDSDPYLNATLFSVRAIAQPEKSSFMLGIADYLFLNEQRFTSDPAVDEIVYIDSLDERMDALKRGTVDYIIVEETTLEHVINRLGPKNYTSFPISLELPFRLLLSNKLSHEYINIFNTAINALDSRSKNMVVTRNLALMQENRTFWDYLYDSRYIIVFSIISLILAVALVNLRSSQSKRNALKRSLEIDRLTGVYTEYKFVEEVQKRLATAQPNEYALLSMDIDRFQYINEIYGYEKGSVLLQQFAEQACTCYTNDAVIARVHADHFILLIKAASFSEYADCLKCARDLPSKVLNENYRIGMSRGVYIITDPTLPLHVMINYANSARAYAKKIPELQRPHYTVFSEKILQERRTAQRIVSTMEKALADQEFQVAYQPKIDLQAMEITGAEALVRWQPADGHMIFPDEFIPVFEQNGFIERLDFYVLEHVCQFIKRQTSVRELPKIAVNASIITLHSNDFVQHICNTLAAYDISPQQIEIEITEGVLLADTGKAVQTLQQLREQGFSIAMDDFGSGYSSLERLNEIRFDTLKIDKSILNHLLRSEQDNALLRGILFIGKSMGLSVVAEGVETAEQAGWLAKEGCDIGQGYYFSKPIFEEEFLRYMDDWKI